MYFCPLISWNISGSGDYAQAIWNNLEDDAMGLVTVPSFEYIMEHSSYYELIRDHIAYYTFDTLTSLMERCGFAVLEASMVNRDTLSLVVRKRPQMETENLLDCYVNLRSEMDTYMKYLKAWNKKVCMWGASHQGFTLAATTSLGKNVEYIIDSAHLSMANLLLHPICLLYRRIILKNIR